jgi:hypothetical protein
MPLLGVVLCCTAVPLEQTVDFASLTAVTCIFAKKLNRIVSPNIVKEIGGVHTLNLTSGVTHLLVEVGQPLTTAHLTTKYKFVAANRRDVRVLKPAWLEAVHQSWMAGKKVDLQAPEQEHKLPIFVGLSVCLTGFKDREFRSQLECHITEYGGDL